MTTDWPTQHDDLYIAEQIIQDYAEEHNNEPIGLLEVHISDDDIKVGIPAWVKQLNEHFHREYGYDRGDFITKLVISNFMTRGQTIH